MPEAPDRRAASYARGRNEGEVALDTALVITGFQSFPSFPSAPGQPGECVDRGPVAPARLAARRRGGMRNGFVGIRAPPMPTRAWACHPEGWARRAVAQ